MAFDDKTRNRLQRFVSDARRVLTDEFTAQLQNDYGLDPLTGNILPLDTLTGDDSRRETGRLLRKTFDHYLASTPAAKAAEVLDRIVREQAFTLLNRLVALRMCEERKLLVESIAEGTSSQGFQLYQRLAASGLGETAAAYRNYLLSVFDEFAVDLGVLFDRFAPNGVLFPREKALDSLLTLINHPDLEPLWSGDETIGWIYQYFNTQEERQSMRKASSAPRNSRELAVRNQFFTPRYVVEFLTDNTLGRTWIEMRNGDTRLASRCRFYVAPVDDEPRPPRAKKDPRDLKILDPACGSGHFLLYSFDLLLDIYEEGWADDEAPQCDVDGQELRQRYSTEEALRRAMPSLILRHNLYGVDVDPRAAQIAALTLWLRAQRAYQEMEVGPQERDPVEKTNVVVAEPMPGEKVMQAELVNSLDASMAAVVSSVFERLRLAGDLGVLLRVEREIRDAMRAAYKDFGAMFEEQEAAKWIEIESRLFDALRDYAEQAEGTSAYGRRLFAGDAVRGLALIDLCRQRYDVVLMNPPFGAGSTQAKKEFDAAFPRTRNDIYAAFVERGIELLVKRGLLGAITSRAGFFLSSFQQWREEVLLSEAPPVVVADLGHGVLDNAMVEVAAYCLERVV